MGLCGCQGVTAANRGSGKGTTWGTEELGSDGCVWRMRDYVDSGVWCRGGTFISVVTQVREWKDKDKDKDKAGIATWSATLFVLRERNWRRNCVSCGYDTCDM